MSEGAFFMIHNASGMAWGDKKAMRDTADLLEKVEGAIVNDYTTKTGKDAAQIAAWMDAETWFTAAEAKAEGFVDSIKTADSKAKNTWNLAAFANAPSNFKEAPPEPEPEDTEQKPAPAGFFMGATNANRLRLAQIV
jgi:hypothetical protein